MSDGEKKNIKVTKKVWRDLSVRKALKGKGTISEVIEELIDNKETETDAPSDDE